MSISKGCAQSLWWTTVLGLALLMLSSNICMGAEAVQPTTLDPYLPLAYTMQAGNVNPAHLTAVSENTFALAVNSGAATTYTVAFLQPTQSGVAGGLTATISPQADQREKSLAYIVALGPFAGLSAGVGVNYAPAAVQAGLDGVWSLDVGLQQELGSVRIGGVVRNIYIGNAKTTAQGNPKQFLAEIALEKSPTGGLAVSATTTTDNRAPQLQANGWLKAGSMRLLAGLRQSNGVVDQWTCGVAFSTASTAIGIGIGNQNGKPLYQAGLQFSY